MFNHTTMDWVKKNREVLITLTVLFLFILLLALTGIYFKKDKKNTSPLPSIEEEIKFDLPFKSQNGTTKTSNSKAPQTTSFFLHPSPTELLSKLENLNYHEFKTETKKLPGLKVMWPAYFFSIMNIKAEKAQIMLDASEDGFGVTMITEVDLQQYPQIQKLKRGKKIWLAAEITGIDPAGTGQFFLKTEYVRFDDYQPPVSPPAPPQGQD